MTKKGDQHGLVHGGEGAVKAIEKGEPMRGLAALAEQEVTNELEIKGRPAMVLKNAIRLQTACDLYWNAVQKAAEDKDLAALDRYVSRFGWLSGCALRAWAELRIEQKHNNDLTPETVLEAVQRGKPNS